MEKRIKIVWILTIVTALLMISGQSYWLYIQYCYSADEYMRNIYEQIVKLEQDEFEARYDKRTVTAPMTFSYSIELPDSSSSQARTNCIVSLYNIVKRSTSDSLPSKLISMEGRKALRKDTFTICANNIPSELIFDATSRYSTELSLPLTPEAMDSVFQSNGIKATDIRKEFIDSMQWKGSYEATGQLFPPRMRVIYPHNPLQNESMTAIVTVPVHPLLKQMMWQLAGSLLLVMLLICCLVYQIKTILKQRKIDEMRKNFVNTMIHELKRPVQTLKMCVSFLNNKSMRTDERAMDEVVKDAMFELDNISAYLAKVRDMTRADYEHTPLHIRTFDLRETIEKLIRLCNAPADKKVKILPRFEMETTLVTADPVHLANIISNLIENAIKYSGAAVEIKIDCILRDHKLILLLSDNGIGIPQAEQGRVFDKFYRGVHLPDRNIPGIGLGLSYVKLLTEAHHGTISLTSHPGKGTIFTLQIPQ